MDDDGWRRATTFDELPDGKAVRVDVEGSAVLLLRAADRVFAVDNRCTHQGAPLNRGPVRLGSINQVTCPAHGSIFNLADGSVLRGPASRPLLSYDARVSDGIVEIRPRA